jgi:hypothetical protein
MQSSHKNSITPFSFDVHIHRLFSPNGRPHPSHIPHSSMSLSSATSRAPHSFEAHPLKPCWIERLTVVVVAYSLNPAIARHHHSEFQSSNLLKRLAQHRMHVIRAFKTIKFPLQVTQDNRVAAVDHFIDAILGPLPFLGPSHAYTSSLHFSTL